MAIPKMPELKPLKRHIWFHQHHANKRSSRCAAIWNLRIQALGTLLGKNLDESIQGVLSMDNGRWALNSYNFFFNKIKLPSFMCNSTWNQVRIACMIYLVSILASIILLDLETRTDGNERIGQGHRDDTSTGAYDKRIGCYDSFIITSGDNMTHQKEHEQRYQTCLCSVIFQYSERGEREKKKKKRERNTKTKDLNGSKKNAHTTTDIWCVMNIIWGKWLEQGIIVLMGNPTELGVGWKRACEMKRSSNHSRVWRDWVTVQIHNPIFADRARIGSRFSHVFRWNPIEANNRFPRLNLHVKSIPLHKHINFRGSV